MKFQVLILCVVVMVVMSCFSKIVGGQTVYSHFSIYQSCSNATALYESYSLSTVDLCEASSCTNYTGNTLLEVFKTDECVSSLPNNRTLSNNQVLVIAYSDNACTTFAFQEIMTINMCINDGDRFFRVNCSVYETFFDSECQILDSSNEISSFLNKCGDGKMVFCSNSTVVPAVASAGGGIRQTSNGRETSRNIRAVSNANIGNISFNVVIMLIVILQSTLFF